MNRIENAYGHFDEAEREYVILRPDTPTPWINYLGEGRYGGIISNTAGGYSFDRDPRSRRVTRYRYNGIPADQPGRYVYMRDQQTGETWSATWQPMSRTKLDQYECRHGAAYTKIRTEYRGIETKMLYFVPLTDPSDDSPCELWLLEVTNRGDTTRLLRTFSYVEFGYFDAVTDAQNLDWGGHIVFSEYGDGIQYVGTKFQKQKTFMATAPKPIGYDSDRDEFIGRCRDLSNPIVVETGTPKNTVAPRGNNIGSFCHEISLAPGETRAITYVVGISEEPKHVPATVARYDRPTKIGAAFEALKRDWQEYLAKLTVECPDSDTNAMLNFWNQVQCRTTLYWSRFVSAYETGLGRGMGTRDTGQDTLGTMHTVPDHARTMLTRIWRLQFQDGHTWHQFFPLTGEGGPGLAGDMPDYPQWFSDDHLWLVISVCAYLRETRDFGYLRQRVPYVDGGEDTIWDHMMKAVAFTLAHLGPRGLPRIGFSDWDDTLNIDMGSGKAESVFTAMQFCRALLDLADLCDALGKPDDAAGFREQKQKMAQTVNRTAWDGAWYARAYDDKGKPIGVSGEKHHRINLVVQAWSIIGEVADRARAEQAMNSLHERLNTPYGVALLWPAYDGGQARVRGTTTYPPGSKENGGIFCHANAWVIVAAAMLGWGDRAYAYYRQILPLARTDSDRFLVEPYVYCQNICGPEHPQLGRGRNAWLTGTAAWTFVAGTQHILGIQPTYDGLRIAPAVPGAWKGFSVTRVLRGVSYRIRAERSGPGNRVSLEVDGKSLAGSVVPVPSRPRGEVNVLVRLT